MRELVVLIFIFASYSRANVELLLPHADESEFVGKSLANVQLIDENDKIVPVSSLKNGQVTFFVPFYAHCSSSCPLTVSNLKNKVKELKNKNFNIILFSFNTEDTAEDLKSFREAMQLPPSWRLYRAKQADTTAILKSIDFRYMTKEKDFIHSALLVVLSPELKIKKFIQGTTYKAKELVYEE